MFDSFIARHIGPRPGEIQEMLQLLDFTSLETMIDATIPSQIRAKKSLDLGPSRSEYELLKELKTTAEKNLIYRSYIGMGYSDCITPPVIQRNILENPGWYTQYTPYQAEIAQGRLEALLNFQTMIMDLTGMEIANASMLDEGTAAAEAMTMCFGLKGKDLSRSFFVSSACHPQTIAVVRTRAEALGIKVIVGDHLHFNFDQSVFAVLLQYPVSDGAVFDYESFVKKAHDKDSLVAVAADILGLALLKPPGEFGADMVVGSTQRFGVPMGYGGPHAAYFATRDAFKRQIPGRLVGLSKDSQGKTAVRLALQTREQHIRRDKATSNICTAQVLLAIMSSMYAVYHGPTGIRQIADRVQKMTGLLAQGLKKLGYTVQDSFFDTLRVDLGKVASADVIKRSQAAKINLRKMDDHTVCVTLDETVGTRDLLDLLSVFSGNAKVDLPKESMSGIPAHLIRKSAYLTHPVFNSYHSETEMLRYLYRLQTKDLSLATSMIPLGSCTMKLNATSEMLPVTWPEFGKLHPFVPIEQAAGYQELLKKLEGQLAEITGFKGISLQPNAGSQGEYTGLLVIRRYHASRGDSHRNVCLIPQSAHGTNPASAALAGMKVVVTACDRNGNIDVADLKAKAEEHAKDLAALMVTYPSTHGVFEESISEICEIIHKNGGQVYMDGANMNAQVGLCRPGDFGPDVCHLNLHKTFCVPHGGGGPGMGPIGVMSHLIPYLPSHPVVGMGGKESIGPVSAGPWGSASILPISYVYISLMGTEGLTKATQTAILNANYIAKKLDPHYPVLYRGKKGMVAHECIVDLRQFKATTGVEVEDVAKRLMDYGYHAPTVSFPVPGTMMIEPTESESKVELDRFCEAMILIRAEIAEIENGKADKANNVLKNSPHTAEMIAKTEWTYPYSREKAVYPTRSTRDSKFWPSVARIDNIYGERNLVCSCPPIEDYS